MILLLALVLILTASIGGTIAYLVASASPVTNTFEPGKVSCAVDETFENNVKSDVYVTNTGNTEAYIRAAIVVNWVDKDGNAYAVSPVCGKDYTLVLNATDWVTDGSYYYYKNPVAADQNTTKLISSCTLEENVTPPEGYTFQVEILASAIQSMPTDVVTDHWNVTLVGNEITAAGGVTP